MLLVVSKAVNRSSHGSVRFGSIRYHTAFTGGPHNRMNVETFACAVGSQPNTIVRNKKHWFEPNRTVRKTKCGSDQQKPVPLRFVSSNRRRKPAMTRRNRRNKSWFCHFPTVPLFKKYQHFFFFFNIKYTSLKYTAQRTIISHQRAQNLNWCRHRGPVPVQRTHGSSCTRRKTERIDLPSLYGSNTAIMNDSRFLVYHT